MKLNKWLATAIVWSQNNGVHGGDCPAVLHMSHDARQAKRQVGQVASAGSRHQREANAEAGKNESENVWVTYDSMAYGHVGAKFVAVGGASMQEGESNIELEAVRGRR